MEQGGGLQGTQLPAVQPMTQKRACATQERHGGARSPRGRWNAPGPGGRRPAPGRADSHGTRRGYTPARRLPRRSLGYHRARKPPARRGMQRASVGDRSARHEGFDKQTHERVRGRGGGGKGGRIRGFDPWGKSLWAGVPFRETPSACWIRAGDQQARVVADGPLPPTQAEEAAQPPPTTSARSSIAIASAH